MREKETDGKSEKEVDREEDIWRKRKSREIKSKERRKENEWKKIENASERNR